MPPNDDARPPLGGSVPKHLQIANHIRREIEGGVLAAGEKIDSERVIAKTFGVARPTATRAITTLRDWGLVESSPGLGTFVLQSPAPQSDDHTLADRVARIEEAFAALPSGLPERVTDLARDIGILQAQMLELREHLNLDDASTPRTGRRTG